MHFLLRVHALEMSGSIMVVTRLVAPVGQILTNEAVNAALHQALEDRFRAQKVLILMPDHSKHTRFRPYAWQHRTPYYKSDACQ
jgi:hypothetical protein